MLSRCVHDQPVPVTVTMQDWSYRQAGRGYPHAVQPFQSSSDPSVRGIPERRDCFEVKGIGCCFFTFEDGATS